MLINFPTWAKITKMQGSCHRSLSKKDKKILGYSLSFVLTPDVEAGINYTGINLNTDHNTSQLLTIFKVLHVQ